MNERVKKVLYGIAASILNLSIILTVVLMGFVIWDVVEICIIHKEYWIKNPQPPELVQPNPEKIKILEELQKADGKN